jgi:very-short-patch-repair endonuclease
MNEIETKFYESFYDYVNENMNISFMAENIKVNLSLTLRDRFDNDKYDYKAILFEININFQLDKSYKDVYPPYPEVNLIYEICAGDDKHNINGYIPDFELTKEGCCSSNSFTESKFVIEIDGHKWHEKTKEQAARDRQKDRAYLMNGYIPIRFSGSEVYHQPIQCVEETLKIIAEIEREKLFGEILSK